MAMSKTVVAGFGSRSTHFITARVGARQTDGVRATDQGREDTIGGAEGTEDTGREDPSADIGMSPPTDGLADLAAVAAPAAAEAAA